MTESLVSVIIPVYNVFSYPRESLDSVIHQTYQNLEILIIDDGSTDGSGEVCDEYKADRRVRVIHQDNLGLSEARNTGLRFMTGEYVAFLDSDDVFVPDSIEKVLRCFENADTDAVSFGFTSLRTAGPLKKENRKEQEVYHTTTRTDDEIKAFLKGENPDQEDE